MTRHVAFLRAINVGGSHIVKMDALRELFEGLGFGDATFVDQGLHPGVVAGDSGQVAVPVGHHEALEQRHGRGDGAELALVDAL